MNFELNRAPIPRPGEGGVYRFYRHFYYENNSFNFFLFLKPRFSHKSDEMPASYVDGIQNIVTEHLNLVGIVFNYTEVGLGLAGLG